MRATTRRTGHQTPTRGREARAVLFPGFVLALVLVAYFAQAPPAALSAGAPVTSFSAERALRHVRAIAGEPRPSGSPGHARVQQYIQREIRALGIEPKIDRVVVEDGNDLANVANITADLPGVDLPSGGGGTVAVLAHYDSVPTGPGAADDAAGVASMLEVIRALKAGPRLRNDVVFVFTDAEEIGSFGAAAIEQGRINIVLNFEARGTSGPSMMFETGPQSSLAVKHFASLSRPSGSSLYVEAYQRMPNDTDFSRFRESTGGLNFAFIDGYLNYHTALDDTGHLSGASLQHQGGNMLELARSFGCADLAESSEGDVVFFDVLGRFVLRYPMAWAWWMSLGLFVGALASVCFAVSRRQIRLGGVLTGALTAMLAPAIGALVGASVWAGLQQLSAAYRLPQGHAYEDGKVLSTIVLLVTAGVVAIAIPLRRLFTALELLCGANVACAFIGVAVAWWLPGASYLLGVSALLGSCSIAIVSACPDRRWAWMAPTIVALPVVLYVPVIVALNSALRLESIAVTAAIVGLVGGVILPQIDHRISWIIAAGAAAVGLVLGVAGAWSATIDADRRGTNSLAYLFDIDTGTALFASGDGRVDEWTRLSLGDDPQRASLEEWFPDSDIDFLVAPAPTLDTDAPRITRLTDADGAHRFEIELGTELARVDMNIEPPVPQELQVDGISLGLTDEVRYWAPPPRVTVKIPDIKARSNQRLIVRAMRYGLPHRALPARPAHLMQTPPSIGWPDVTIVKLSAP